MNNPAEINSIQEGNRLFNSGDYVGALKFYEKASEKSQVLRSAVALNIKIAKRKLDKIVSSQHNEKNQIKKLINKENNDNSRKILLVSYYCPTRAHAGGLRILDIYKVIKNLLPTVRIDLLTHHRPNIDWAIDEIYTIFDNVVLSQTEELNAGIILNSMGREIYYDIIDIQFHPAGKYICDLRKIGKKILFTPMESALKVAYMEVRNLVNHEKDYNLSTLYSVSKNAIEELEYCKLADAVICVSNTDAEILRKVITQTIVVSVETCLSEFEFAEALTDEYQIENSASKSSSILYIAYFGSQTNVDALRWYLNEVHPLIIKKVPDYSFLIAGRGDLRQFEGYESSSVKIMGEVNNLYDCIRSTKIGIAPALSGAGFRGKINQYAICGVPCVATSIAALGLDYEHGKNILVADAAEGFAESCIELLMSNSRCDEIGHSARMLAKSRFAWSSQYENIRDLYELRDGRMMVEQPMISILIPSYNHGKYIIERILSIYEQTYKNFELFVIDDCSIDDSNEKIVENQLRFNFTYIRNPRNSGTPFSSWEKVLEMAKGKYIWICESDDVADPNFLEVAVSALESQKQAVLFYCASEIIDSDNRTIGSTDSYFANHWKTDRWDYGFVANGRSELRDFQLYGQTVPNMSSALISAFVFRESFTNFVTKFHLTGDWLFAGELMLRGDVIYSPIKLNKYRKHEVTARAQVRSSRSQAEFILTKYRLYEQLNDETLDLSSIMENDCLRLIHEEEEWHVVFKEMLLISYEYSIKFFHQFMKSIVNNKYLCDKLIHNYSVAINEVSR